MWSTLVLLAALLLAPAETPQEHARTELIRVEYTHARIMRERSELRWSGLIDETTLEWIAKDDEIAKKAWSEADDIVNGTDFAAHEDLFESNLYESRAALRDISAMLAECHARTIRT